MELVPQTREEAQKKTKGVPLNSDYMLYVAYASATIFFGGAIHRLQAERENARCHGGPC